MSVIVIPTLLSSCIWVASEDDGLDPQNRAPVAHIDTVLSNSVVGVDRIEVSPNGSFDPDEDRIRFSWRFTDPDGEDFRVAEQSETWSFVPEKVGDYVVQLTVSDDEGLRDRQSLTFPVYNRDPTPVVRTCSPDAQRWSYNSESLRIEGAGLRSVCIDFGESYDIDTHDVAIAWQMFSAPGGGDGALVSGVGAMRLLLEADGLYEGAVTLTDPYGGRREVAVSLLRMP